MASSIISRILPHANDNGDFTPPTPFQLLDGLLRQVSSRSELEEWERDYRAARSRVLTNKEALQLAGRAGAVNIRLKYGNDMRRAA